MSRKCDDLVSRDPGQGPLGGKPLVCSEWYACEPNDRLGMHVNPVKCWECADGKASSNGKASAEGKVQCSDNQPGAGHVKKTCIRDLADGLQQFRTKLPDVKLGPNGLFRDVESLRLSMDIADPTLATKAVEKFVEHKTSPFIWKQGRTTSTGGRMTLAPSFVGGYD